MTDIELAARLLLSLFFGILIGIERQWHHKNAGLKTNTLVVVGATAFALISERGFGPGSNPTQIAAGVVTGIGFIGGGVIMHRGGSVQGINTAATLWTAAGMGLAIGIGYYKLAWLLLLVVLMIQLLLRWVAAWINQRSGAIMPLVTYHFAVSFIDSAAESVRAAWSNFAEQPGVSVVNYSEAKQDLSEERLEVSFKLSEARARNMTAFGQTFAVMPGVRKAEWSQSTSAESE